jgi:hypothetical protein
VSDHISGEVLRVNLRSGRVQTRTRVGSAPHHVAVAGGDVLVAVHDTDAGALVSSQGRLRRTLAVGTVHMGLPR